MLVENKPWGASSDQSFILQEKLNAYLSFILDGEMLDAYPAFRNKSVRLVLECVKPPTGRMLEFLQLVHDQCALQGIQFMVDVIGKRCGCGEPLDRCEGKIKSGTEHLTQKDPAAPE